MTHEPLMEIAIEPKSEKDAEALYTALLEMMSRDPPIRGRPDQESGQFLLCGDSEPELDEVLDELINGRKIGVNVGAPQVAYLETLGRAAEIDHAYTRQTGGSGQFARMRLLFEPSDGYAFQSRLSFPMDPEFIDGVQRGLEGARSQGLLAGFKVVDFRATLLDAAYHDIDSSPIAFEIAAREAFKQLREKAEPLLIEPIMALYVTAPLDALKAVEDTLKRKRGAITSTDKVKEVAEIAAFVPLANLFGYVNTLRGETEGQGFCTMRFSHYAPVPAWPGSDDLYPSDIGMRA